MQVDNTQVSKTPSINLYFVCLGTLLIVNAASTQKRKHIAGKMINDFIVYVIIFYGVLSAVIGTNLLIPAINLRLSCIFCKIAECL
jgi:hypothetical protein